MRRFNWLTAIGLAIIGVVIGVLSYNAGYSHGLAHTGTTVQVVRDVGFPFFIFPLAFFAVFFLLRIAFWSSWRRRGPWGPQRYDRGRFDDWHREQHADEYQVH